jgi:hypothetical protein
MVAGVRRPEGVRGEPDDVGVYRDLDGRAAGAVVLPAGIAHARGLSPGAEVQAADALLLARGPGAAPEGLLDGVRGVADGGVDAPPVGVVRQGGVASLGVEDLGELADVELAGRGAGGGADPQPVAAADGQVRRQAAGDRPGDAQAGRAATAGRAQRLPESLGVAQVIAGSGQ